MIKVYNNGKFTLRSLAMMGQQDGFQEKLFITGFSLDKRIPEKQILRKISETIDFDFIYKEV